jgi:diguanylate cyclase (GGDEF)-like protein
LDTETRFVGQAFLCRHGLASGLSATISAGGELFGVLGAYSARRQRFTEQEVRLVQAVANVLATALQRQKASQQIQNYMALLEAQKVQLENANVQLQALATSDELTGLKNHRAFQKRLSEELDRARNAPGSLSLLLIDVDHFKQYNDTFGHPAGDDVLRAVARLLQGAVRTTDFVARYGGEEFAVILPGAGGEEASEIGERLRTAVASAPWLHRAVTASFGAATLHGATHDKARLISEADKALYLSKRGGRNRVTHRQLSPEDRPALPATAAA